MVYRRLSVSRRRAPRRALGLTIPPASATIEESQPVGLWRSWERASMAWKRSSVRSRPGPPNFMRDLCAHTVQHTFLLKPSKTGSVRPSVMALAATTGGNNDSQVDELVLRWNNVPGDTAATIYCPDWNDTDFPVIARLYVFYASQLDESFPGHPCWESGRQSGLTSRSLLRERASHRPQPPSQDEL
jgi:hypothetical protein